MNIDLKKITFKNSDNLKLIKKIWELLNFKNRFQAKVLLCLTCFGVLLEALSLAALMPLISILTKPNLIDENQFLKRFHDYLAPVNGSTIILGSIILLTGFFLIKSLLLAYIYHFQAKFSLDVAASLSKRLYGIYLNQPLEFHLQRNSSALAHNVLNEIGVLGNSGIQPLVQLISEMLVVFFLMILLMMVEPIATLATAGVLLLLSWMYFYGTSAYVLKWGGQRLHHERLRAKHIHQGFGAIKNIILSGKGEEFIKQYQVHNESSAYVGRLQVVLLQIPRLILEFIVFAGFGLIATFSLSHNRSFVDFIPTLALFSAVAFRLLPSTSRIISSLQTIQYGLPSINHIYDDFSLSTNLFNEPQHQLNFEKSIALKNITYVAPDSGKKILKKLSLNIKHGEVIGLIGSSGVGKSTLVNIILGLLNPSEGCVEIDGFDLRMINKYWKSQIGYVPQDVYLIDDTLRRNVAFGIPDNEVDDALVFDALRGAQLLDFIKEGSEGLDLMVGERGVRLSGGQVQRIGIARALYHNPSVIVLDEATSSLDINTEADLMQAIFSLKSNKTIIIVAHRYSALKECDHIYELTHSGLVKSLLKLKV